MNIQSLSEEFHSSPNDMETPNGHFDSKFYEHSQVTSCQKLFCKCLHCNQIILQEQWVWIKYVTEPYFYPILPTMPFICHPTPHLVANAQIMQFTDRTQMSRDVQCKPDVWPSRFSFRGEISCRNHRDAVTETLFEHVCLVTVVTPGRITLLFGQSRYMEVQVHVRVLSVHDTDIKHNRVLDLIRLNYTHFLPLPCLI